VELVRALDETLQAERSAAGSPAVIAAATPDCANFRRVRGKVKRGSSTMIRMVVLRGT
jgi:hypothetical protein